MTTRIDYVELPEQIKTAYDSTNVKRVSRRTTRDGVQTTYTVETYKGTHKWQRFGDSWVSAASKE